MKLILLVAAATACTNPVEPSQKFMGDPPVRIDPAPGQGGFQLSQATRHP
ncbi:MAG TPA: hypothetical protein VJ840_11740 [Gemmatimonadaceae bacterium]|nr:hypothetical protein [Gemmatimonadaceae bacterium]